MPVKGNRRRVTLLSDGQGHAQALRIVNGGGRRPLFPLFQLKQQGGDDFVYLALAGPGAGRGVRIWRQLFAQARQQSGGVGGNWRQTDRMHLVNASNSVARIGASSTNRRPAAPVPSITVRARCARRSAAATSPAKK